jgi:TRAP-type C4-dicarboxylate transport system permease small subunit
MEEPMKPAIRRLSVENIATFASRWLNWIAAAGLVAAMIIVCINVIGRAFFHSPLKGTVDITGLLGAFIIAGAIPYTQIQKGHIRIGLLVERLPHRVRYITETLIHLIGFAFFAVTSWQTILFSRSTFEIGELSEVMKIPLGPVAAFVSAGCIALALVLLIDTVHTFKKAVWK